MWRQRQRVQKRQKLAVCFLKSGSSFLVSRQVHQKSIVYFSYDVHHSQLGTNLHAGCQNKFPPDTFITIFKCQSLRNCLSYQTQTTVDLDILISNPLLSIVVLCPRNKTKVIHKCYKNFSNILAISYSNKIIRKDNSY